MGGFMKSSIRLICYLMLSIVIIGCATRPTNLDDRPRPLATEKGRIYVYRIAPKGLGVPPMVYINGAAQEELWPRIVYYRDMPPGQHEVSVGYKGNNKIIISLDKGQKAFVRFDIDQNLFGKGFYPVIVDPQGATAEIKATMGLDIE
jgi:hypothetical protein